MRVKPKLFSPLQDISLHIEYLLRYHDCVILPGIGAFLRTRIPARVRPEDGALLPGYVRISFNGSITSDDALIAHSIARRENMSFEQARISASEHASLILSHLRQERELLFGNLGTLTLNAEDNICFQPLKTHSSLPILQPLKASSIVADSKEDNAREVDCKGAERFYTLRIPKRLVRYAAMIAVVAMGWLSLSMPRTASPQVDFASVVPRPAAEKASVISSDKEKTTPEATLPAVKSDKYFLIVAAANHREQCELFISQNPGHELKIIPAGKRFLVYTASSTNREALLEVARTPSVKQAFGQTWIFEAN